MGEILTAGKKLHVSVVFDIVKIEIYCGDAYEANVVYDDLIEKLKTKEGVRLTLQGDKITR